MRLTALLLIFGGVIEAAHRHRKNRPIFVSKGSSTSRSTRRFRDLFSSSSTSSSTEYSTEMNSSGWDGTISQYSFDPNNSSVYSSPNGSDSLEQSVISTFQQSLQAEHKRKADPEKKRSERNDRRGKETKLFEDMVRRHAGAEVEPKRLSTREQTAQIQGPRRSQVREARQRSILRRESRDSLQQQPHYLYTKYHKDSSDSSSGSQSIPSDQSYTIEFSSEHHRRFRRHISRSHKCPTTVAAVLAQPGATMNEDPQK